MSGWGGWGGPPPSYTPPHYTPSPPPLGSRRGAGQPFIPCPRPLWPTRPGFAPSPSPRFYCPSPLPRFSPSPRPYSPAMCPSPEYYFAPAPFSPGSFTGVPLEPPGPPEGYLGMSLEAPGPPDGRATAEIIASQSQDYVDEKLAEYQATIYHLQGKFSAQPVMLFGFEVLVVEIHLQIVRYF